MQKKQGNNTEISERISKLLETLDVNANAFALAIGYKRAQTVYDAISGKSAPGFDFFNKLAMSEYSEIINLDWLLTGRGEILLTKTPQNAMLSEHGEKHGIKHDKRKLHKTPCFVKYPEETENMTPTVADVQEPLTSTGIPLSQVRSKIYATSTDEEISEMISDMMEKQMITMYEEGRIFSRKAVDQLISVQQETMQAIIAENAELKSKIRQMQQKSPGDTLQHRTDTKE